ncbi:MAG: hypothetical protein Q7R58_02460 [bacterium]|nr:hypothetical protein [bacterium]
MKDTINTYFATLLITIAGAGATLLIVHVALANSFEIIMVGNEAVYSPVR